MATMTLLQAFESYKAARAKARATKEARVEADERSALAREEHLAALTAEDNAKNALDALVRVQSEPA